MGIPKIEDQERFLLSDTYSELAKIQPISIRNQTHWEGVVDRKISALGATQDSYNKKFNDTVIIGIVTAISTVGLSALFAMVAASQAWWIVPLVVLGAGWYEYKVVKTAMFERKVDKKCSQLIEELKKEKEILGTEYNAFASWFEIKDKAPKLKNEEQFFQALKLYVKHVEYENSWENVDEMDPQALISSTDQVGDRLQKRQEMQKNFVY